MPEQPHVVVALSGGMDSSTLTAHYAHTGHRLTCVSVDYGQRHRREITAAEAVAGYYGAKHEVVDISALGQLLVGSALTDRSVPVPHGHYAAPSMAATIVPNRNALIANILVAIAVGARADIVALGMHAGDHAIYPDCRPVFVDALAHLVAVANEQVTPEMPAPPTVEAPFVNVTKTDIARIGTELGVPFSLTWSCYEGGGVHCGQCGTCVERREAFDDAGLVDPTEYAQEPA